MRPYTVDAAPLTESQFDRLWRYVNYEGAPDDWRLTLIEGLVKVAYLTCAQAAGGLPYTTPTTFSARNFSRHGAYL